MEISKDKLPKARLAITLKALAKAEAYAQLTAQEFGTAVESIGYLLTDREQPGPESVITDVMLAHDQKVSGGSAQISPAGVLASGREIERRGQRSRGWWHAHPNHAFHSATDDENMQTVLTDLSASGRWSLQETEQVPVQREGDVLVIRTATETIRISGDIAEIERHALTASAVYSLVVSATGHKPYAEMATRIHCAVCGREQTASAQVPIELVDPDSPDYEALRTEIRHKVRNLPEMSLVRS